MFSVEFFLVEFGFMPSERWLPGHTGCLWWLVALLLLTMALWRSKLKMEGGNLVPLLLNKPVVGGDRDLVGAALKSCRGGGLKGRPAGSRSPGKFRAAELWSSYMAAKLGCCDPRPRWRPLHTPVQLLRLCVSNLLKWRLLYLDAAVYAFLRPSGLVPGAEQGRRIRRCVSASRGEEDEGLDCFLANHCKVLLGRNQDHVIFSFSVEALYVNCNATADE
jgi:hypothetical protein